jgi:hypothetical protein
MQYMDAVHVLYAFLHFSLVFDIYHRKPKLTISILLETLDLCYIIVESELKGSYLGFLTLGFVCIA